MDKFNVGDKVYITEEGWEGKIVELHGNSAFVEFRTSGGGGCLEFDLSELEHEKWCITTDDITHDGIVYLGWQNPAWMKMDIFGRVKKILRRLLKQTIQKNIHLSLQVETRLSSI